MKKQFVYICVMLMTLMLIISCKNMENNSYNENSFINSQCTGSMDLKYAKMFTVNYYENGDTLIEVADGRKYLIIPSGGQKPSTLPKNVTLIEKPLQNIYLAASSAMDLFSGINALDSVRFTSTKENDWTLPEVKEAISGGTILYAGKYSAPDYEMLLSENCGLAIESTMIYHKPEVLEQLENSGIPVFVERSSYESHPLGRLEWIRLYGVLVGKEKDADEFFNSKLNIVENISAETDEKKKTVIFFYVNTNGSVVVRKSGDYVSQMIELAGGEYIIKPEMFSGDDNAMSSMNMQFEAFYNIAKDADILIYNGAVDGGISSIGELVSKNSLFADFKAVRNGNVWCSDKNMFQKTTATAEMVADMNTIFNASYNEEYTKSNTTNFKAVLP